MPTAYQAAPARVWILSTDGAAPPKSTTLRNIVILIVLAVAACGAYYYYLHKGGTVTIEPKTR